MTDHDVIRALSLVERHAITPRDNNERAALFHALHLLRGLGAQRNEDDE